MLSPYWSIQIHLSRLCSWHETRNDVPSLDFIAPLQRRRLSPLARINLQLAHDINPEKTALRCVFASRHGEIVQTTQMLQALASDELLSPARFSHSVHNAIQGLWSIQAQQTAECSAISAGIDTLPMGLLEAATLLADQADPAVLLMCTDEAVPAIFNPDASESTTRFALAGLINAQPANLKLSAIPKTHAPMLDPAHLEFLQWWRSNAPQLITAGARCNWQWTRL
ncbi:beta-ketoacyl synthase chain length factor [Deefgea piscis]|uniref:beta-ketoacyl synthase chain length factor n=1 Tax=Deefgea piscis TaxID=2739061 RepID=UPI001C81DE56|nr:beta-ketoacyl synthase chain length factor [Deefgea piscis]QZA82545.1 beta-ketoacyl synthase chain length factor [Deefgea piscis]